MPSTRFESESVSPDALGKPLHFEFSGRSAPNRFLKGAMSEKLASWDFHNRPDTGVPTKEYAELYRRWAEGGFGLVLSGNVMIAHDQIEAPANAVIPPDAPFSGPRFDGFAAVAKASQVNGSLLIAQLSHPGRQVTEDLQPDPVSASDVQLKINMFGQTFAKPHPASQQEIHDIVEGFAHAAEFLYKAGWDGIELHGAHGYLLAQFLAETTNLRTDQYGGSIQRRAQIIIDIAAAIRKRVPDSFVVGIKLNSVEFQEKGLTPEDSRQVACLLEENRFDFVELTGGTFEKLSFEHTRESTVKREAYFMEFAEEIVPSLKKTKVYITGGFLTVGGMVGALDTVDGVGLGRPAAAEPRLPNEILSGKVKGAIKPVFQYNDFSVMSVVSGTQMRQAGRGEEPFDSSNAAHVKGFQADMAAWRERMAKLGLEGSGFFDLTTLPGQPYGTLASASESS